MIDNLFDVSRDVVVITGVSGQLGSEYASAFLERGAKVVGLDIYDSDSSGKLASNHQGKYKFIATDVTKREGLLRALRDAEAAFGVPSVLINNAAIDSPPSKGSDENGPFESYPEAAWDRVISVNLKGVYLCCQVFGGAMAEANKGSIINVSSIYGVVSPDQSLYEYRRKCGDMFYKPVAYSASKSGILNFTRYLAVYWAKRNVRVNSLTLAGVFNKQESAFVSAYCARIPVGRMANADEYNGSVLFLASEASRYMTGHNLVVDGGWTAI